MSGPINIAITGCGYWGPNLVRNFHVLPDVRIKKICDSDPQRLSYIGQRYPGIKVTEDFNDVLQDETVDACIISTPAESHFNLAYQSLSAGKHTFVEKPMALSTDECRKLIDVSDHKNLTLMVGHTFLYSSAIRKIKDIIESGTIGHILYISSQRLSLGIFQNKINVAWDLAPHDLSIIMHLVESYPVSVNCQGKAHVHPGVEDVTNMSLNFSNGCFAIIQNSWLDPSKIRRMTIVGSRKMILYDDTELLEKIKIFDRRVETPPHYDTFAEFHYSYHYGDMYSPYISQVEPLKAQSEHFIHCIQKGLRPQTNGSQGLKVIQILEAAQKSLLSDGCSIHVEKPKITMD